RWLNQQPAAGVRVAAGGDIMWGRGRLGKFLTPELLGHLQEHDVGFGNLETPVSNPRGVYPLVAGTVAFNSEPGLNKYFARPDGRRTFSALATANNHCLDKGDAGLADTLSFLDSQRIAHSGARRPGQRPWTLLEIGGLRLGFYAACWGLNDPAAPLRSAF